MDAVIAVLLTILKILGITLLAVLGLVVLILLVVLLVPFRYDLKLRYKEKEVRARVRVHWLLKLILVKLEWLKKDGLLRVKALGFTVFRKHLGSWAKAEKQAAKAAEEEEQKKKDAEQAERSAHWQDNITVVKEEELAPLPKEPEEVKPSGWQETVTAEETIEALPKEEPKPEPWRETILSEEELKKPEGAAEADGEAAEAAASGEGPEAKAEEAPEAEKKPKISITLKGQTFTGEDIKAFLEDRRNQDSFALILKQLGRVGKHFLPTHLLVEGTLGLGDPAKTGQIIGRIYSFAAIYGDRIRIDGVYDREEIDIYAELKGRIRLGIFVAVALRLLANKNFRRWLKFLMKKDKAPKAQAPEKEEDNGRE